MASFEWSGVGALHTARMAAAIARLLGGPSVAADSMQRTQDAEDRAYAELKEEMKLLLACDHPRRKRARRGSRGGAQAGLTRDERASYTRERTELLSEVRLEVRQ